ncbi:MAG: reverse transcriptase/maturase family protein [Candidatus Omnitrophica bacterium]|nr:reverse transcriptase/maturase family protein [Candidatus Omnitrophota bacterium]
MQTYKNLYSQIVSFENLLCAYRTFRKGKRYKNDVLGFDYNYEKKLLDLQDELVSHAYTPLSPHRFYVYEPKKRAIEAAVVRDRVVHHALCRVVEPIFDKRLIYDTYACRRDKGTLAAIERFEEFKRKLLCRADENRIYIFKADISKYFENIDHGILLGLISERIKDKDVIWLISRILNPGDRPCASANGIPIGNLTSQFFANLYLNPLDQFVKHDLRIKYYIRYMDDFVLMDLSKDRLQSAKAEIARFLEDKLQLRFHPKKQTVTPLKCGIDFLGFRIFYTHRLLRKENAKRFARRIKKMKERFERKEIALGRISASINGWIAHAKHGNTYRLRKKILRNFVLTPV